MTKGNKITGDLSDLSPTLIEKLDGLVETLTEYRSAIVAYSGGVDSSFLAYLAWRVLQEKMAAVSIISALDPPEIQQSAIDFARLHGFKHVLIDHDPLLDPNFTANPADRCYHCKLTMLGLVLKYARENSYAVVVEGQNVDDLDDYRPGRQAVKETGTVSPLAQHGLTKVEIRQLARAFGLAVWNQPSSPCLATRIPYGTMITPEVLAQVARAERYLHEIGFRIARVRHHGDIARIEVEPDEMEDLLGLRKELVRAFKSIGYRYIALDLQGYRLGSLNEGLF